jgi:hypothetical protein
VSRSFVWFFKELLEARIAAERIKGATKVQQNWDKKRLDPTRANFQLTEERIH